MAPTIDELIFVERYLKLPQNQRGITPFPAQLKTLRDFYGSKDYRELVLVWGRRSGKGFVLSLIAIYEAFRLSHEDRSEYAGKMFPDILVVSGNSAQSRIMMREVASLLQGTDISFSLAGDTLKLVIKEPLVGGKQICIRFVSAGSSTIVGLNCYSLLLNEIEGFRRDAAEQIYATMAPVISGNKGRIITVSSPRAVGSFLHRLATPPTPSRLVSQAATWEINPNYTKEALRKMEITMSDQTFDAEYGAVFPEVDEGQMEQVTLRLPTYQIEKLKRKARRLAYEEDRDFAYTDIIRDLVNKWEAEL